MRSIKFTDAFKIIKPEYTYIKLKPSNSIRNNNTHKIARAISSLYKNVLENIKKEDEKLVSFFGREFALGTKFSFEANRKITYFIYIEKSKIEFYFIIPTNHLGFMREKISDVWQNITIEEVTELPEFSENVSKYQLVYEKEDALSLAVDRRDNDLLNSNLNIVEMMEEGDKVGIVYNFMPMNQNTWIHQYRATREKVKRGAPVDRNKTGLSYLLRVGISLIDSFMQDLSEVLAGKKAHVIEENASILERLLERMNGGKGVSGETEGKMNATIIPTQIVVMSDSQNKLREKNNARALAQSFDTIRGDNKLKYKPIKKLNIRAYSVGAEKNKMSDLEISNLISVPGRDILENYNFIEKVETKETQVPEDLRVGKFRLGVSTFRGNKQEAFLTTHPEYKNLSLFLIGPQRAGKTTLIGNLTYDAIMNDECVVLFDFIENCEMSTQVASLFSEDQVLNIVCDDENNMQGIGYNEIRPSDDPRVQYINAKNQTTQLMTLINSINTDEFPLTARMRRYLISAALIVYLSNGPFKDIFAVLQNHVTRHEYIMGMNEAHREDMEEYLGYLTELDHYDKDGVLMGTKLSSVEGIISRLNILKDNPYMELMIKKSTENNIDLVEEFEKNKLICIKMPETMFNTDDERDVYCTYWITKVWLALQVRASLIPDRDKRKKVNLFIDEMYQVENTEKFIASKLNRFAKYRMKPIVSCHYLGQLKHLRKELVGANASYLLISGCDKSNFKELEAELKPFDVDDLLNLQKHHAMALIKNNGGYGKFITHLPAPVSNKNNCLQDEKLVL